MKICYSVLLSAVILSCTQSSSTNTEDASIVKDKKLDGRFVHMVFFWLTPEADSSYFMEQTEEFLKQVAVIRSYHLGTPAMTAREVVDNTYSVSLVVTFDSKEDQDIYQKHEAHLNYIEEMSSNWQSVKIYDSYSY